MKVKKKFQTPVIGNGMSARHTFSESYAFSAVDD